MPLTKIETALYVVDAVWSLFVIFPVLAVYWSGTWGLLDAYMPRLFPNQDRLDSCVCIAIGGFLTIAAYFVQPMIFQSCIPVSFFSLKHILISRISIYVCSVAAMFFWRGIWNLTILLISDDLLIVGMTTIVSVVILILLKSSGNPIGSPFYLQLDTRSDFYQTYPRFRQQVDNVLFYTFDVLLTVCLIMTMNIIVWVGLWKMGDLLILPNNNRLSMVVSLIVGCGSSLVIFAVWFPIQSLIAYFLSRSWPGVSHLIGVVYNVISVVVVLFLWRGLWGLMQDYFTRGINTLFMAWICHIFGFLVMILLQVGKTFGGLGCAVDGETSIGDWPMEYFIVYYRYRWNRDQYLSLSTNVEDEAELNFESEDRPLLTSAALITTNSTAAI